jgi:hypothetical protein
LVLVFRYICVDAEDGVEYAVVRWADDSHSLEPTERLREDMDNRVYQQLRSMAYMEDDDTPEVINAKFLRQEAYVRNLPNADAVNARRSARNHASPCSPCNVSIVGDVQSRPCLST